MSSEETSYVNLAQVLAANEGTGSVGKDILKPIIDVLAKIGIEATNARYLRVLQQQSPAVSAGVAINTHVGEIINKNDSGTEASNDTYFKKTA